MQKTRSRTRTATPRESTAPDVLGHLRDSLYDHWRRYCKRHKRCRRKFSVEAVHNLRVETRRLLAIVELLRAFLSKGELKKVRRGLKARLDMFDRLRDTQVQLVYTEPLTRTMTAAKEFQRWLKEREARFIRQAREEVAQLRIKRLGRRMESLEKCVCRQRKKLSRENAWQTALDRVDRAFGQVVKLCRQVDAKDTATIHRTRIAFKKFRYMTEAMSPLLPHVTEEHRQALRGYQSMMGDIQDAEVLLTTLDKFIADENVKPSAACSLRDELSQRRQWLIQVYINASGKLRELWPIRNRRRSAT